MKSESTRWKLPVFIGALVILALCINYFFYTHGAARREAEARGLREAAATASAKQADEARQQAANDAEAKRLRENGEARAKVEAARQKAIEEAAAALGLDLDAMTEEERTQLAAELEEMMQVRRQVAATPASEMLTNYLMRFFDLATIYLEAEPPAFADAATVIEACRSVLDGVGDRLGEHEPLLREALGQAQMVFVQVKNAAGA